MRSQIRDGMTAEDVAEKYRYTAHSVYAMAKDFKAKLAGATGAGKNSFSGN
jgi:hypothetical protein